MKLLLTAFDPFGGEKVNAALEAMKRVPDVISGAALIKAVLPTAFGRCVPLAREAVLRHRPDAVLCLGQAAGRAWMTPERVAINLDDARMPDNEGVQPADEPIVKNGPAAYFSTLPVKAMAAAVKAAGIPAALSNSAGTFVCNHLMYGLLHMLKSECPQTLGGFMHVPLLPEQAAGQTPPLPSLPLADIVKGIEVAVAAVAAHIGGRNGY